MLDPLKNFKNPWEADGEYAQKFLNIDHILDRGDVLNNILSPISEKFSDGNILTSYNMSFLIDLGGHQTLPNLTRIRERTNTYFSQLDVRMRTAIFPSKELQDFDYDKIGSYSAIVIIGEKHLLADFLLRYIYIKYDIRGITSTLNRNNYNYEDIIKHLPDNIRYSHEYTKFFWKIRDALSVKNPEVSTTLGLLDNNITKVNIVAINYDAIVAMINNQDNGYSFSYEDFMAYTIAHGIGHTAGTAIGLETHPGGIMSKGDSVPKSNLYQLLDKNILANQIYKKALIKRYTNNQAVNRLQY